jgi:hypothetical protein
MLLIHLLVLLHILVILLTISLPPPYRFGSY